MKKIYLFFFCLSGIIFFAACSEDIIETYHAPGDNVYFNINDDNSLLFSFTDTTQSTTEVTLLLPVKLSGARQPYPRTFNVGLIDSLTTAQAGIHYEALAKSYELQSDSGTFLLPIVLYNKNEILLDSTLTIGIILEKSDDFGIEFPKLISATVSFSNRLEEPGWWMYWRGELGTYSRTKHFFFLISSGTKNLHNPSIDYYSTPKALYHISQYKTFMNDPFSWVAKNPEYAIEKQSDTDYLFYLKDSPNKSYHYVYESSNGKYYFKDENGEFIYV